MAAYPAYVLTWDDLWPFLIGRRHIFEAAGRHFEEYLERHEGLTAAGLTVTAEETDASSLRDAASAAVQSASVLIAALDPFELPTFAEFRHAHGFAMGAVFPATDPGAVRLWHWENSTTEDVDRVVRAMAPHGNRVWRLSGGTVAPGSIVDHALRACRAMAATGTAPRPVPEYVDALRAMWDQDAHAETGELDAAVLFAAPYHRLRDGSFFTSWLVRSAANRLMHARGCLAELTATASTRRAALAPVAEAAAAATDRWRILNILTARHELRPVRDVAALVAHHLQSAFDDDSRLRSACAAALTGASAEREMP